MIIRTSAMKICGGICSFYVSLVFGRYADDDDDDDDGDADDDNTRTCAYKRRHRFRSSYVQWFMEGCV